MQKNPYKQDYSTVYEALGIEEDKLPDLRRYYERAHNSSSACTRSWGSPERFVNALYWMKFVKKYDWYDIAELTGNNYISVRYNFFRFGWYNNLQTLEECEANLNCILQSVQSKIDQIHLHPEVFESSDYQDKEKKIIDTPLHTRVKKDYHCSTERELFKLLYFLISYCEMTTTEIALYYNVTPGGLRKNLNKYNIGLSRKEARERTESKGNGNHARSRTSFNKRVIKHALVSGLSNEYELLFRDLITSYLPDFININQFDYVVGVQTVTIVPPQEIDIPIVFINKTSGKIYKYAIELNGKIWHEDNKPHHERDQKKINMIEETDWKLITINFIKMTATDSRVNQAFIDLSKQICELLKNDIKDNNTWKYQEINISQL